MHHKHITERLDFMRAHLLANADRPVSLNELEKLVNGRFLQNRESSHKQNIVQETIIHYLRTIPKISAIL